MSAIAHQHEAATGYGPSATARMKVLHVIPGIAPRYGGPSLAVLEMCRRLAASGTEPLIVSTDADGAARLPVTLEQTVDYQGVPTVFFRRQWSEAFKYSLPLAKWLSRHVGDFDAVHIHAVYSHSSIAAARAARRAGVPYVVRPLGSLNPWARRHKPLRKLIFWHAGVRTMLREAAAIHYTSHAEQRQAEAGLGLARGVVIPLGLDVGDAQDSGASDRADRGDYVLALGRLHPVKGLELLIDAFLDVAEKGFSEWKLKLVGDGDPDYVEGLKRRVQHRSAEKRVEFAGWLEGQEKEAVLSHAALLAMPSHQENFGIAMFEALSRTVPVVVSDQIDWAQDIEAAGAGWVSPLDRRSLAAALTAALTNDAERAARGKAGAMLVRERFAWPVITSRLREVYLEISTSRQPAAQSPPSHRAMKPSSTTTMQTEEEQVSVAAHGCGARRADHASAPRICVVAAGHLSTCPRMLKAADALVEAGYEVRVVSTQSTDWAAQADVDVRRSRSWRWVALDYRRSSNRREYIWSGLRYHGARGLAKFALPNRLSLSWAARAYSRMHSRLVRAIRSEPCDLIYAGQTGALAAAAIAACRLNVPYALDLEDFHSAELADDPANRLTLQLAGRIEHQILPNAQFLTAGSAAIADAYQRTYGRRPIPINNTFPLPAAAPDIRVSPDAALKLYWFSQTIGPGRGLEDIIRALGLARLAGELHLRGSGAAGYLGNLRQLAQTEAPKLKLVVHAPGPPDSMVDACRDYDVGLALEQGRVFNRTICLTNKAFTYMLAGLALVFTDTPGQRTLIDDLGVNALVYQHGDIAALAAGLKAWSDDRPQLLLAKRAAWEAAQRRWHWEHDEERGALLDAVAHTFANTRSASMADGSH